MHNINREIKNVASDLSLKQQRLAELQKEKYAALTSRGMAMLHLPDSNVKLIIPATHVEEFVKRAQFVISEDSTEHNATGVLTPFDGQLNVTYFTGD